MATTRCLRLNVGGKIFMTTTDTLQSLPDTRLGRLARDDTVTSQQDVELFFDRNPEIMNSLLDLYRSGELHAPKNLCAKTVERELEFWDIPGELIQECCFRGFHKHKEDVAIIGEIDKFLSLPYESPGEFEKLSTLGKIWFMMERPSFCLGSKILGIIYFMVVAFSVLLLCMGSSMSFRRIYPHFQRELAEKNLSWEQAASNMTLMDMYFVSEPDSWILQAANLTVLVLFLEFLFRFLACPSKSFFFKQNRNRLDVFLFLHNGALFVLEKLYFYGPPFYADTNDFLVVFYSLSALRLLRILYVIKDFDVMKMLLLSTRASLKVQSLLAMCMVSMATLYGTAVYLAEILTKDYTFHTIPHGMWYAVVTLTTVGYGDTIPMGTPGRLLGVLCAFSGVIIVALPVAVIASTFSKYHDNLASRTQLRSRVAFLKDSPDFLFRKEEKTVKERPEFLIRKIEKIVKECPGFHYNVDKRVKKRPEFPLKKEKERVKECPDSLRQTEEKKKKKSVKERPNVSL